jgi:hypothetical protein
MMIGMSKFRAACFAVVLCAFASLVLQGKFLAELTILADDVASVVARSILPIGEREEMDLPSPSLAVDIISNNTTSISSGTLISRIHFGAEKPLFVLSLANHYDLVIPRYFECAGYNQSTLGRLWLAPKNQQKSGKRYGIAQCFQLNMHNTKKKTPITQGCGKFHVWTDLQYLQAPKKGNRPAICFDPVMYPGALDKLGEAYPNGASILNLVRDPLEWAQTMSLPKLQWWHEWCNDSHNNSFPGLHEYKQQRSLLGFYLEYQYRLKQFVQAHPTWNYIEVDLRNSQTQIALEMEQQLGIEQKCWMESSQGNVHIQPDSLVPSLLQKQRRINDVTFPMLVTAMPKAGTNTVHDYFLCGLGNWVGAHQWAMTTHEALEPFQMEPIGECMLRNADNNTYPFFKGCGYAFIWSDTGLLRPGRLKRPGSEIQDRDPVCFYPFLHRQGLERFYASYPYGTILNVIRNTTSWVSSAIRWKEMPKRWVKAKCDGFPSKINTTVEEWGQFYESITHRLRAFAKAHPSLTYIEVPLSSQTGAILKDIFRFPDHCFGHSNVNTKIPVEGEKINKNDTKAIAGAQPNAKRTMAKTRDRVTQSTLDPSGTSLEQVAGR